MPVWAHGNSSLNANVAGVHALSERTTQGLVWVSVLHWGRSRSFRGVLRAGSKTEVCFVCLLNNGRRFAAQTDLGIYQIFAPKLRGHSNCARCKHYTAPDDRAPETSHISYHVSLVHRSKCAPAGLALDVLGKAPSSLQAESATEYISLLVSRASRVGTSPLLCL